MKRIFLTIIIMISSCKSLTLISPGITSDNRLGKNSGLKFEESSFYGTDFYQLNVFYIENENKRYIFQDPNNIIDSGIKENFEKNINENDILLLSEVCFDKDKFRQKSLDLTLYDYSLNSQQYIDKIEYIYPYSFIKKGNSYSLERPLLINDYYPNQRNVIKTSDDFVTCSRSIIKFKKEFQYDGTNKLNITTPRKSIISFEFSVQNGKFVIQNNEEIEFNIKAKSRL
ncbi:hypothetical protein EHR01_12325 [Leptospira mtsangambouensis]|uniref:Lipoprotein n=1 Tax=Leptospira mtsangambouensis TaxID=2484912 RepID=A0ABY2NYR1_9LEPT|nr:hypothetical protein [Leptospira mtsangambouensis]TGM74281.1 hypothetical protein EHR01_12325 [Leptospira mtsangambouensis]